MEQLLRRNGCAALRSGLGHTARVPTPHGHVTMPLGARVTGRSARISKMFSTGAPGQVRLRLPIM